MECPVCKTEMRIVSTRQEVIGDESPDQQTEVFTLQELACRNKACPNYEKVMASVKTKIYP